MSCFISCTVKIKILPFLKLQILNQNKEFTCTKFNNCHLPHSSSDPPWAPGKPAVREVGKTTALLAWIRPEHDGGAKIAGYIIEFQKTGSEEWIRIAEDVPQTEHQLQGLMEQQEYSFRVKAVNKAGESEPSEPSDPVVCKERLCKI